MSKKISLSAKYAPSEDVVAREVAGEFIIIPIASGIGDLEDEIFSLNASGKSIWDKLSAEQSLRDVARELSVEFEAPVEAIQKDCLGLIQELLERKIVVDQGNN